MTAPIDLALTVYEHQSPQALRYEYHLRERIGSAELDEAVTSLARDVIVHSQIPHETAQLKVELSFVLPQEMIDTLTREIREQVPVQQGTPWIKKLE